MARTDSRAGDTLLGCPSCSSTCSSFAPEEMKPFAGLQRQQGRPRDTSPPPHCCLLLWALVPGHGSALLAASTGTATAAVLRRTARDKLEPAYPTANAHLKHNTSYGNMRCLQGICIMLICRSRERHQHSHKNRTSPK